MCLHVPYGDCGCRKPGPEMLIGLMKLYGVSPESVLFVGDRDVDRDAASNAGCDFQWVSEFFNRDTEKYPELEKTNPPAVAIRNGIA